MKAINLFLAVFALLTSLVTWAAEPAHVVIDPSDQYATTFVALPKDFPAEKFERVKGGLAERRGSYLVSWRAFKSGANQHISAFIRRNDYPEVNVVHGLTLLLEQHKETPFGLTWNGGLAVTGNDYRYAERTYRKFTSDPNAVARTPDRRGDPVHPENHLGPLLRQ